jgi:hypothetical protein
VSLLSLVYFKLFFLSFGILFRRSLLHSMVRSYMLLIFFGLHLLDYSLVYILTFSSTCLHDSMILSRPAIATRTSRLLDKPAFKSFYDRSTLRALDNNKSNTLTDRCLTNIRKLKLFRRSNIRARGCRSGVKKRAWADNNKKRRQNSSNSFLQEFSSSQASRQNAPLADSFIETILTERLSPIITSRSIRPKCLLSVNVTTLIKPSNGYVHSKSTFNNSFITVPSLYVLNPTSLSKPHAKDHIATDLLSYNTDIALIAETWYKGHHTDSAVAIQGYNIYRKDRLRRRGGGVCIYITNRVEAYRYQPNHVNHDKFEVVWIRTKLRDNNLFIASLYHPPPSSSSSQSYASTELLDYLRDSIESIVTVDEGAIVILGGDFNQLNHNELTSSGLISVVNVPTHKGNYLDRIYTTAPLFTQVKAVLSTVNTAHKAIVANGDLRSIYDRNKVNSVRSVRLRTPSKNAHALLSLQSADWNAITSMENLQGAFDKFYETINSIMALHYPLSTVTITNKDPEFVTPRVKILLRRKNKLMKHGQIEKASGLAEIIRREITSSNASELNSAVINNSKDLWRSVHRITGSTRHVSTTVIDAATLNEHYANVSTDSNYRCPARKSTCHEPMFWPSQFELFTLLDSLKPTAIGPDGLPEWLLRLGAPVLTEPICNLFNRSITESFVPSQWKGAHITPIPKTTQPLAPSDYRPISITSVLSRVFEKLMVKHYLYPVLNVSPVKDETRDQFAFRPTGSTTAAVITLISRISSLLENNHYVRIISLDFSKAFDSIRHSELCRKLADTPINDCVYNWIVSYLKDRFHCTKANGILSQPKEISASVVQGSAIGPISFIFTSKDLKPVVNGNELLKYADDSYLIIPSSNDNTVGLELSSIETWASENNLKLNRAKTYEMIASRKKPVPLPAVIDGIERTNQLEVLGVTLQHDLRMEAHINKVVSRAGSDLYALKTLRHHGLPVGVLSHICRATLTAKLTYASPSWRGFCSVAELSRLDSVVHKANRWGLCHESDNNITSILDNADKDLFDKVLCNPHHVLKPLLPPVRELTYSLRPRGHSHSLPIKTNLTARNFVTRMLYSTI